MFLNTTRYLAQQHAVLVRPASSAAAMWRIRTPNARESSIQGLLDDVAPQKGGMTEEPATPSRNGSTNTVYNQGRHENSSLLCWAARVAKQSSRHWLQPLSRSSSMWGISAAAGAAGSMGPFAPARCFVSSCQPLSDASKGNGAAAGEAGASQEGHSDETPCSTTRQVQEAQTLQQLEQLVQQHSSSFSAPHTAAAFTCAAQLAAGQPAAAEPLLQLLAPIWQIVLPHAAIRDVANCLYSWTKLQYKDERLWSSTLAAVPQLCKDTADGQDISNIAYALAAMSEANSGVVPGVSREQVAEVLRAVTHELVSMVSVAAGRPAAGDGRSVTAGNIATLRWAHEVVEI